MVDDYTIGILKNIKHKYLAGSNYKLFIFGSRTGSEHRPFCDLDVGILGSSEISAEILFKIKTELSESDIPYLSDVVDFHTVSSDFKKKALEKIISI